MRGNHRNFRIGIVLLWALALVLICGAAMADGNLPIEEATFPNENFRNFVQKNFDTDNSWDLSEAELNAVDWIRCPESKIGSVQGAEYFPNLERLTVYGNQIKSIDISRMRKLYDLDCSGNQLTSLDVSKNPGLKVLSCGQNKIQSLDVSGNDKLISLYCVQNGMTTLKLSSPCALEELYCFDNQLSALDISGCAGLKQLICYGNQISSLNLSAATGLVELSCMNNPIKKLDLSACGKLEELYVYRMELTALDVSKNPELNRMLCAGNPISSLDLSRNEKLHFLSCEDTSLTKLDVSGNPKLERLLLNQAPEVNGDYYIWGTFANTGNPGLIINRSVQIMTNRGAYSTKVQKLFLKPEKVTLKRTAKTPRPTAILQVTVLPVYALNREVTWKSSNPKVAVVNSKGKVTAKKAGQAVITCVSKEDGSIKATCKVTVKDTKVTRITLNKTKAKLRVGKTLKLKATVKPAQAVNKELKWTTSNKKIATVDKNGKVTAKSPGIVVITCTAQDGSKKKAKCTITVR